MIWIRDWPWILVFATSLGILLADSLPSSPLWLAPLAAAACFFGLSRDYRGLLVALVTILAAARCTVLWAIPEELQPQVSGLLGAREETGCRLYRVYLDSDPKVFTDQIRCSATVLSQRHPDRYMLFWPRQALVGRHVSGKGSSRVPDGLQFEGLGGDAADLHLEQGEIWLVNATTEPLQGPRFPGDIDNRKRLGREGIVAKLRCQSWKRVCDPGGILAIRHWMRQRLIQHFTPSEAALVIGVTLGDASLLPQELENAFHRTSTTHLLAASGANVALLVWIIGALGSRLGLGSRPLARYGLLATLFYMGLAGFAASIVRASWMSFFVLLARHYGLACNASRSLALACLVCLWWDPSNLFDCGFQMSAGAVASLIWLQPPIARLFPGWLASGMAVFWGLFPISVMVFGEIHLGGIVANLLIAPFVEVLLPSGLGVSLVPILAPALNLYTKYVILGVVHLANYFDNTSLAQPNGIALLAWLGATLVLIQPRWHWACLSVASLSILLWSVGPGPGGDGWRECRVFCLYGKVVVWWQGQSSHFLLCEEPKLLALARGAINKSHQGGHVWTLAHKQWSVEFSAAGESMLLDAQATRLRYGHFQLIWGKPERSSVQIQGWRLTAYTNEGPIVVDLRQDPVLLRTDGFNVELQPWKDP